MKSFRMPRSLMGSIKPAAVLENRPDFLGMSRERRSLKIGLTRFHPIAKTGLYRKAEA